ncbi:FAD-dependent oxidoreductase [Streptomyces sp. NPDC050145]|uniref:FAD-dependent oxidoreductase n=1 Tax=Streptomyces sp. NPDC050145 TaxID=3365602 RepID=UPI00379715F8
MRPIDENTVPEWDADADVVIAGYGVAGAAAAVAAAQEGAEVLVLERAGGWGGAAALSGGFIYLGGGTALQQACGYEDTPANMAAFLTAALGPGGDPHKIGLYSEGSPEHYDWLTGTCAVAFRPAFFGEPAWEAYGDEGLMYSGGENAHPFPEIADPAPRGHLPCEGPLTGAPNGEQGRGRLLMEPLVRTASRLGVTARYDTRVDGLVVAADGRVCGVRARSFGRTLHVRARRGVVLTTGSFTYDAAMVGAHTPRLSGRPGAAVEEHDGISIRLGQALGAQVSHLDACEVAVGVDPQHLVRGIVVNAHGQRFINEDTYAGRIGQAALLNQGNGCWLVLDETGFEEADAATRAAEQLRTAPTVVAETPTELAAAMGLPEGALESTLDLYNRHAEQGRDPVHHKAAAWLRPLKGPLGAVDLGPRTAGFALGGLTTDTEGRVLHVDGAPVPGLYAAGRATTGIATGGYASGASLGDGTFFGRRAGHEAAQA